MRIMLCMYVWLNNVGWVNMAGENITGQTAICTGFRERQQERPG